MDAVKILRGVYEEEHGGCYIGGTLLADAFAFNANSYEPINGMFSRSNKESQPYTEDEKYWWSKCYLKFKTEKHAFWNESKVFVELVERRK